jgi:hypothetical protein
MNEQSSFEARFIRTSEYVLALHARAARPCSASHPEKPLPVPGFNAGSASRTAVGPPYM